MMGAPSKPALADLKTVLTPGGAVRPLTQRELDRLWSHVSEDENGCWIWTGSRYRDGYGSFTLDGRSAYTHRIMYMIFIGEIAKGMHTDHLCRVRECCNPEHLEIVTARENLMRSPVAPAALNAAKTHCKRGHELSGDNVRVDRRGGRACRACAREKYHAKKAQQPPAPPRRLRAECSKGHPFDSENTLIESDGRRRCRACRVLGRQRPPQDQKES